MKINLTLNEPQLANQIRRQVYDVVDPIETAMADRFCEITKSNFGIMGPDRPIAWPPLSPAYARKVKREIATLFVSGTLKNAVHREGHKVEVDNADVPYALAQNYGYSPRNLPARPYFPIDSQGRCLSWTLGEITEAGQNKLNSLT